MTKRWIVSKTTRESVVVEAESEEAAIEEAIDVDTFDYGDTQFEAVEEPK